MAHLEKKDIKQAIRSGLIGLAIGDALGVPIEFLNRNFLELMPVTEMLSVGTHHQPAGTWSDDTSMTICIITTLWRILSSGICKTNLLLPNSLLTLVALVNARLKIISLAGTLSSVA